MSAWNLGKRRSVSASTLLQMKSYSAFELFVTALGHAFLAQL